MMRQVFAGRYLPVLIILLLLIVPNLVEQAHSDSADAPILLVLFLILFVIYMGTLVSFGTRYWNLKKRTGR